MRVEVFEMERIVRCGHRVSGTCVKITADSSINVKAQRDARKPARWFRSER